MSDKHDYRYVYAGSTTDKQAPLKSHDYRETRFPSVLQLWVNYPQIALEFNDLTEWMNHDEDANDPREQLVLNLANAVWADEARFSSHESWELKSSLSSLYRAAGFEEAEEQAENLIMSGHVDQLRSGDRAFTRDTVSSSLARFIDNQDPHASARRLLSDLYRLNRTSV